mmetsp:Transcript_30611/g.44485  ORF Transcript_30611/g.44485 Transcript_30611/m.44485 type:complete len:103 (+) Transcript_30611:623-931(+)
MGSWRSRIWLMVSLYLRPPPHGRWNTIPCKKHLGKINPVYFFEFINAPFTVLGNAKNGNWGEGFTEEFDLGKAMGKQQFLVFEQAFQLATVEYNKPIELNLE